MRLRTDSMQVGTYFSGEVIAAIDRIHAQTGITKRVIWEAAVRRGLGLDVDPVEQIVIDTIKARPVNP